MRIKVCRQITCDVFENRLDFTDEKNAIKFMMDDNNAAPIVFSIPRNYLCFHVTWPSWLCNVQTIGYARCHTFISYAALHGLSLVPKKRGSCHVHTILQCHSLICTYKIWTFFGKNIMAMSRPSQKKNFFYNNFVTTRIKQ